MAKLVSKTYGEALFEIAMEGGRTDSLLEEADGIRAVLADNPELDQMMKHPGIPKQDKLEMLESVFRGRISGEMLGFLEIVIQKERYGQLQDIFQYFTDKVKEVKRIGTATVITAVELTPQQKEQVKRRLLETTDYRTMEVRYQVNPELIGGMIIRIKDRVVDSSIRARLNDLTKQLLQIQLG